MGVGDFVFGVGGDDGDGDDGMLLRLLLSIASRVLEIMRLCMLALVWTRTRNRKKTIDNDNIVVSL